MDNISIRVAGLSKQYQIGKEQKKYHTLRDSLVATAVKPFRAIRAFWNNSPDRESEKSSFMALKDVSFDVKQGE
jgi:ABC-type polysaccharide/polyol phosphate transport system ATPase subunit